MVNDNASKMLNELYSCWSSSFPDGIKTPASKKEIAKSKIIFEELKKLEISDDEQKNEIALLEKRYDTFFVRKFDGFYRAMIGSGLFAAYVLYVTIGIIKEYGFLNQGVGIAAIIIFLWGIVGTVLYYFANQAPCFLIDDLLSDKMQGNKIAEILGMSLDMVSQNIKPTTVVTHYSDGSTARHVDYSNSAIAGLFPIVFRFVCKYIAPVITAPFMALKKYLHNYVFFKNQKEGGIMASFLRYIGAM